MNKKPHVYVYSPSGAVRDKAAFRRGVRFLEKQGCDVEVDSAALDSHLRFAGDDDARIAAIQRAASSGADVALISRGGYGLTRILDRLPYNALARAIESGTQFVGISDFTALQAALFANSGATTWAGPALCEGFGAVEPDDIMVDCFFDLVSRRSEGTGWRVGKGAEEFQIENALLWGGNLTVLCGLVGTPFFPTVRGGILFVEDIAEHPYRVERLLTQLLHSGVLAKQKALILGQFTDYKLTSHDKGFKLQTVVDWIRSKLDIPVLTNLPFGHVPTKVLLPFGHKVDLTVFKNEALIVWGDH